MNNLREKFRGEIVFSLRDKLKCGSIMQVPRVEKVVVNVGCGDAAQDKRFLESSMNELQMITGQKPQVTRSKKSIAEFKLRAGQAIGLKVTLRGDRMWHFIEKLFNVVLPRVRDFRGISGGSFDGRGNLTIGLKEQTIFTEIVYDDIKRTRGMDITFVTSTDSDSDSRELLLSLGCPLTK